MDQFDSLAEETEKIDVKKLLSVFYEEAYEEYFPLMRAESDKKEKEAEGEEDMDMKGAAEEESMVMKEMVEKIPKPQNVEFPPKFVDNVKGSLEDAIYMVITDVIKDFMHGRREGKYLGWKNKESPAMLFAMAGAQMVDPEAKSRLAGVMEEMGVEMAQYAYELATHAGRTIVCPTDIDIAAKRFKNKVNITQDDLRSLIRDELARLK